MTTTLLSTVLRDGTISLHGPEVPFDLPQALLVIGLAILLLILTGVVFLRVRFSIAWRASYSSSLVLPA
jgi:hypothetical protein